jgi:hypothetical protein
MSEHICPYDDKGIIKEKRSRWWAILPLSTSWAAAQTCF